VNSEFLKEYTKNESLKSLLARRKVTHSMSNPNSWNLPSMQYDMSYFMHEISLISYITKLHHLTSLSPEQQAILSTEQQAGVAKLITKLEVLITDLAENELSDERIKSIASKLIETEVIGKDILVDTKSLMGTATRNAADIEEDGSQNNPAGTGEKAGASDFSLRFSMFAPKSSTPKQETKEVEMKLVTRA
jgi:hypothetical protein